MSMNLSSRELIYIKVIGELTEEGVKSTSSVKISRILCIKAPSAVDMVKKLSKRGLVEHTPWKGIKLTEKGLEEYRKLIRKNKIIETFLYVVFGMNLEEASKNTSKFYLYVPLEVVNAMCTRLSHPRTCPHGFKIPIDEKCCRCNQ